jgi:hypothetical protein
VFEEETKLETSCSELEEEGVQFKVGNQLADKEGEVSIGFDLTDKDGGEVGTDGVCGGLTASPSEFHVAPGRSQTVTLEADDEAEGKFSGAIILRDGSERVVKRGLSIDEGKATGSGPTPLVEKVTANFTPEKESLLVPVKESSEDSGEGLAEGSSVGAVASSEGPLSITYGGTGFADDETPVVKLELAAEDPPTGTYSGKADLTPEADGGAVSVEITISDSVFDAFVLLVIGILLGVLLQWLTGNLVPRGRLLARIKNLAKRASAATEFVQKAAAGEDWGGTTIRDVAQLEQELRNGVKETMGKSKLVVQIDKTIVAANETAIAAVEAKIDLLKELPAHAQALRAALGLPPSKVPDLEGDEVARTLDSKGGELLGKPSLAAGEIKAWLERMDTRSQQIISLRELEARLKALWAEAEELRAVTNPGELSTVREVLREAWRCLMTADGTEELKEALDLLVRARDELLKLRAGVSDEVATALEGGELRQRNLAQASEAVFLSTALAPEVPEVPMVLPQLTEDEADNVIARARTFQWAAVGFAAVLAVITGLLALYYGKAWGLDDPQDVLTTLTWGVLAQATITTLVAALNDLGVLQALRR